MLWFPPVILTAFTACPKRTPVGPSPPSKCLLGWDIMILVGGRDEGLILLADGGPV